jgi:peptidoglycan/xylan/chitin deacetylase (PgdA/CDA1 family)
MLTHDVDLPFVTIGVSKRLVLRGAGADLLLRRDPFLAWRRLRSFFKARYGDYTLDPYNTFNSLMDVSEKYGLISHFYFIAGHTAGELDGFYSLDDPSIRKLIKQISQRGHEIGLHPSYNSFKEVRHIRHEFEKLLQVADEEGIQQSRWGGRQHYLRWEVPTTWQAWENAGLNYDSTLSFVDIAGFRCGTCYDFTVFNVITRKHLELKEYPLTVMEITLFCESDGEAILMNMSQEEVLKVINLLAKRCKQFNGIFVFLWHNNSWIRYDKTGEFYKQAVKTIAYPDC